MGMPVEILGNQQSTVFTIAIIVIIAIPWIIPQLSASSASLAGPAAWQTRQLRHGTATQKKRQWFSCWINQSISAISAIVEKPRTQQQLQWPPKKHGHVFLCIPALAASQESNKFSMVTGRPCCPARHRPWRSAERLTWPWRNHVSFWGIRFSDKPT